MFLFPPNGLPFLILPPMKNQSEYHMVFFQVQIRIRGNIIIVALKFATIKSNFSPLIRIHFWNPGSKSGTKSRLKHGI